MMHQTILQFEEIKSNDDEVENHIYSTELYLHFMLSTAADSLIGRLEQSDQLVINPRVRITPGVYQLVLIEAQPCVRAGWLLHISLLD